MTEEAPPADPKGTVPPPVWRACVYAKVILSSPPFPLFGILALPGVPRPGDMLQVQSVGTPQLGRVDWITFTPFDPNSAITVGLSFNAAANQGQATLPAQQDLNAQMDRSIDFQDRIFEKLTAYTNVVMLAGYAGLFALWSYTKEDISRTCSDLVAILLGISVFLYVTHEIFGGYIRSRNIVAHAKNRPKDPSEYFANEKLISDAEARLLAKSAVIWKLVYWPTVLCAYAALLILMYNLLAKLLGLPFWPK